MNVSTLEQPGTCATPSIALRRVVWSSVLGTTVEWYDFLIYGAAAALLFNKLFFPSFSPAVGTIAAFGSYAVGFVGRPLGGAIFGHFGDRIGRKAMLAMTILIMGLGTFLIGCLPTYGQIGIAAPLLLIALRMLQGIGIGGEWGGAVLMVIESVPNDRRGYYGSLVQLGYPLGVISSTGVFALVSKLPQDEFLAWGWRVPFLSQRNTRWYRSLHSTPPVRNASIPSSSGQARHREGTIIGDLHQTSRHVSYRGRAQGVGDCVCQRCNRLFDHICNAGPGDAPQHRFQRHSAGCRHRNLHDSGLRLPLRPLRAQAIVHRGLPVLDPICLPDVLALRYS
jgi:Sugar (and other) transporter